MGMQEYGNDGPGDEGNRVFKDFDCPDCNANNPYDDGISDGAEVRCFYCGAEFKVRVQAGKMRFKAM